MLGSAGYPKGDIRNLFVKTDEPVKKEEKKEPVVKSERGPGISEILQRANGDFQAPSSGSSDGGPNGVLSILLAEAHQARRTGG